MKTIVIAAVLAGMCAVPVYAADNTGQTGRQPGGAGRDDNSRGPGMTIDQKKTEILQLIEQRIARSQEEKGCVQAAKSHDDLRACREKFRPMPREGRQPGRPSNRGE